MGKLKDGAGQQHVEFESFDAALRAQDTLNEFDRLRGDALVDALVANRIFLDRAEVKQEFSMGQDRGSGDFGGRYTFDEYVRGSRDDWRRMLAMIADGTVEDGIAARKEIYGGGDNVSQIRQRLNMLQAGRQARNILDRPKPR